jgi:glycosyltransferase EpsJ
MGKNDAKEQDKKISIIVATYNCEKYISRLIQSILNQSYQNFELIIVNDGSTDNTMKIIKEIDSEKIIFINKKNTGVSDSRNEGLKLAKGELITFMDADDYVDDGYLEKIIYYFTKYPKIEILGFGYYSNVEDKELNIISTDKFNYKENFYLNKSELNIDLVDLWDKKMLYNIWNKVYKREIIEKNKLHFFEKNWGEDMDFNQKYMDKTSNFYISNMAFYHYIRERKGASTVKYREDFFEIRKKEYNDFNKYFEYNKIPYENYIEFSSRRFIECVLGVVENIYCSNVKFSSRYKKIKKILNDKDVIKSSKIAKPKTIKTKIMLVPIKMRSTVVTMIMGKSVHIIKINLPGLFNHLKNTR